MIPVAIYNIPGNLQIKAHCRRGQGNDGIDSDREAVLSYIIISH